MPPMKPGLVSGEPVRRIGRRFRSSRGELSVHGRRIAYESGLERDFLHLLSMDPTVVLAVGQPLTVSYLDPATGRERRYTPDVFVQHGGERPGAYLIEVKYRAQLWERFGELKPGFLAARRLARENGWTFRIRTEVEIRGPKVANLEFLRGYADLRPDPATEEQLAATLATVGPSTPRELLAATYQHEDNRARAIPHLWGMVIRGRIEADLALPLTMSSRITITVGEGYRWTDPYSYRSLRDPAFDPPGGSGGSNAT